MIRELLATLVLIALVACSTAPGSHSQVNTVFGVKFTTPQVGTSPALQLMIGMIRTENIYVSPSNQFQSATEVYDSGLLRPGWAKRYVWVGGAAAPIPTNSLGVAK